MALILLIIVKCIECQVHTFFSNRHQIYSRTDLCWILVVHLEITKTKQKTFTEYNYCLQYQVSFNSLNWLNRQKWPLFINLRSDGSNHKRPSFPVAGNVIKYLSPPLCLRSAQVKAAFPVSRDLSS